MRRQIAEPESRRSGGALVAIGFLQSARTAFESSDLDQEGSHFCRALYRIKVWSVHEQFGVPNYA
jgi:hypothetical protein